MSTNNSSNMRQFCIEGGPSLDRLLDMFKYAYDVTTSIGGSFVVAEGYTAPRGEPGAAYIPLEMKDIILTTIQHESGNDHCFNLSGYCKVALGESKWSTNWDEKEKKTICKSWKELVRASFDAFYDTKTRKGTITYFI